MSFALFHRPGTVVFLDDDFSYLEMLAEVLPHHWHVLLYLRAPSCLNYLRQDPERWEADAWTQQQIVDRWREGTPLIPQVLRYWQESTARYDLTRVCVFDYAMPSMNGLQVLAELGEWQESRVLLTGQADEQIAVRAFNDKLIDQFIAKQTPDISRHLIDVIQRLQERPNPRHAEIWRATLTPEQNALLRVPSIAQELREFASKRWVEHVVLGDPFGILGLDAQGRASWLQLEPASGLSDLAELALSQGVSNAFAADIRKGKKLLSLELQQAQLLATTDEQINPSFAIGPDGSLFGSLFNLDPAMHPGSAKSYNTWLASKGERTVKD